MVSASMSLILGSVLPVAFTLRIGLSPLTESKFSGEESPIPTLPEVIYESPEEASFTVVVPPPWLTYKFAFEVGDSLSNTLTSTDHTLVHATTLDDAEDNFAVGDNDLVFVAASGSGDWSGMLYLECIQV